MSKTTLFTSELVKIFQSAKFYSKRFKKFVVELLEMFTAPA